MKRPRTLPATSAKAMPPGNPASARAGVFSGCFGLFLALALLKFNNPPIMEKYVETPKEFLEFVFSNPWPIAWGYWLLGALIALGLFVGGWPRNAPKWTILLPGAWLLWQVAAGVASVDHSLSHQTLVHFAACVACFYLGFGPLGRASGLDVFWAALALGFCLVLVAGWSQQFGGLEESRRYFYLYVYPQMKSVPPEFLTRIQSKRIFATLFYPNALAGALLIVTPPLLAWVWSLQERFTVGARSFLAGTLAIGSVACLFWSGSKAGWLLTLILGLVAVLHFPIGKQFRIGLISLVLVAGLAGFFVKYATFFRRGATSVSARFDYWSAAVRNVGQNPMLGSGPGTFAIPYAKLKRPESEPTRLVHNDYLQQATDSGIPGGLFYTGFIWLALFTSYPRMAAARVTGAGPGYWFRLAIWLGVLGWALQSFVEFCLYIPALAWTAFALLGLLTAWSLRLDPGHAIAAAGLQKGTPSSRDQ